MWACLRKDVQCVVFKEDYHYISCYQGKSDSLSRYISEDVWLGFVVVLIISLNPNPLKLLYESTVVHLSTNYVQLTEVSVKLNPMIQLRSVISLRRQKLNPYQQVWLIPLRMSILSYWCFKLKSYVGRFWLMTQSAWLSDHSAGLVCLQKHMIFGWGKTTARSLLLP